METLAFEMTDVTDVLVPLYTVVVLLVVAAYHLSPEAKVEDRYYLKKVSKTAEKKDWREMMTGYFHQSDSDGFDDWLKFLSRPYPIRVVAPMIFHKIHIDLKLDDTYATTQRFWSPDKAKGEVVIKMKLGTCREDAPGTKIGGEKPEDCGTWRSWVKEGEEKLYMEFCPDDQTANPVIVICREVIDEDTLQLSWSGSFKGKTGSLKSTYRRV